MTIIDSTPVNLTNLLKALDQVGETVSIPSVEHLQAPAVDTIGELLAGAASPAAQTERLLGAVMGLLQETGVPKELAAVAVEELVRADPAKKSAVRGRLRTGLGTLKDAAAKRR